MSEPLSYPPEILIESKVELPAEFITAGSNNGWNVAEMVELMILVIEFVIELPSHL